MEISVVTPVYGCRVGLIELYLRLVKALEAITSDFEIIMVNDASPDGAWETIVDLAQKDKRVKGISLSRNFGQHHAITAGMDYSKGDWVILMDCDLQDQPEEIIKLYNKAVEGFDIVVGRRKERKDKFFKRLTSKLFFKTYVYLSGAEIDNSIGNFGIYSKKVINNIRKFKEQNRSFGLFALWSGFKRAEIDIDHAQRSFGRSSYSFRKLINLAFGSIIAHSNKLLNLTIKLGFLIALCAFAYSFWLILRYLIWGIPILGWLSIIISILFSTGLIMCSIGVVGAYIGKIFDEVKNRPLYIVDEVINIKIIE